MSSQSPTRDRLLQSIPRKRSFFQAGTSIAVAETFKPPNYRSINMSSMYSFCQGHEGPTRIINSKGREIIMLRPANKIAQPRQDIVFRASDFSMSGRVPLTIRLRPTLVLLLLIVSLGIAQRGAAQGVKFTAPVIYPVGAPYVVAAGDFNRDGKMDLVAGDVEHNSLIMLLGNGDGTLKPAVTYQLDAAPYEIIVADFNRDGRLDLATANSSLSTSFSILFGNGDGTFQSAINTTSDWGVGSGPYCISVGDFDRDGKLDILVTDEYLTVLKGNGAGSFKPLPGLYLRQTSVDLKSADFNGDGKLDLVSAGVFGGGPKILLGNGDGTFQDLGNLTDKNSVSIVV